MVVAAISPLSCLLITLLHPEPRIQNARLRTASELKPPGFHARSARQGRPGLNVAEVISERDHVGDVGRVDIDSEQR